MGCTGKPPEIHPCKRRIASEPSTHGPACLQWLNADSESLGRAARIDLLRSYCAGRFHRRVGCGS